MNTRSTLSSRHLGPSVGDEVDFFREPLKVLNHFCFTSKVALQLLKAREVPGQRCSTSLIYSSTDLNPLLAGF